MGIDGMMIEKRKSNYVDKNLTLPQIEHGLHWY
jgi:hypothetical protein